MDKIDVVIRGVTPYLMHAFNMEEAEDRSKVKIGSKNYDNEVEKALYKLPDGQIYVPATQILGSLTEAGKNFQIAGKRKATYSKYMGSMISTETEALIMNPQKYEVDKRAVVVPSTKARIVRQRPKFLNWELKFTLVNAMPEEIGNAEVKKILDYAGTFCGIGDFRPQKKGMFGKFIVTKFEY